MVSAPMKEVGETSRGRRHGISQPLASWVVFFFRHHACQLGQHLFLVTGQGYHTACKGELAF